MHVQTDFESRKPHIARDITIARARNDDKAVKLLCTELDSLSHLSYDPLGQWGRLAAQRINALHAVNLSFCAVVQHHSIVYDG